MSYRINYSYLGREREEVFSTLMEAMLAFYRFSRPVQVWRGAELLAEKKEVDGQLVDFEYLEGR